ncbi:MAG: hypothetical protein L6425_03005 [Candidatus Aminicenantes bacterium]|nr:hypothetical protein [Candidatus Aminicenantes bacterium]
MRNARLDSKGFSLFEVLLSTSVFLLLYISSMAVFQSAKKQNAIQRTEMETQTAAALSLDKIQMEASRAGLGLIQAIDQGLLNGIGTDGGGLTVHSAEFMLQPPNDLFPGQNWIALANTSDFKKGWTICLLNEREGETKTLLRVEKDGLELDSGLSHYYIKGKSTLIAVETLRFYLDDELDILRRKVNASPAQPLCLEVNTFECDYDPLSNLLSLSLTMNKNKERMYERNFFPKNMAPHRISAAGEKP